MYNLCHLDVVNLDILAVIILKNVHLLINSLFRSKLFSEKCVLYLAEKYVLNQSYCLDDFHLDQNAALTKNLFTAVT